MVIRVVVEQVNGSVMVDPHRSHVACLFLRSPDGLSQVRIGNEECLHHAIADFVTHEEARRAIENVVADAFAEVATTFESVRVTF